MKLKRLKRLYQIALSFNSIACFADSNSMNKNPSKLRSVFDRLRLRKNNKIFLLDGGTGEELIRCGVPDDRNIWSAVALVKPEYHSKLEKVHSSYLTIGGANAITTNSYGVVPGVGFDDKEERLKLIALSGEIARRAAATVTKNEDNDDNDSTQHSSRFVFGSLGPLIESYRADTILSHDEGVQEYTIAIRALSQHVDAFLAETMSCVDESLQVIDSIHNHNNDEETVETCRRPLLVSYTLNTEGNFRDDEEVTTGLQRMLDYTSTKKDHVELMAILFNCVKPEAISLALTKIKSDPRLQQQLTHSNIVLGAYANRLTDIDPNWTLGESEASQPFRSDMSTEKYYGTYLEYWMDHLDVKIVGGCCGFFPEDIRQILDKLGDRAI